MKTRSEGKFSVEFLLPGPENVNILTLWWLLMVGWRTWTYRQATIIIIIIVVIISGENICAGTIFQLGSKKLIVLSVGEEKIDEKLSIQSNSKYNFMQYVFFRKRYAHCTMGYGTKHRNGEFSRIFVLKVTLQSVRLHSTASYRNKKLSYRRERASAAHMEGG